MSFEDSRDELSLASPVRVTATIAVVKKNPVGPEQKKLLTNKKMPHSSGGDRKVVSAPHKMVHDDPFSLHFIAPSLHIVKKTERNTLSTGAPPQKRKSPGLHRVKAIPRPFLLLGVGFLFVLMVAIAVPLIALHTMAKVERHTKADIAHVEAQINVAQSKGENTEQLYTELLEKQRILDSLLAEKGVRNPRSTGDTLDVFIDEVMLEFYDDDYTIPPSLRTQIKEYVELYSTGVGKKGMQQVMLRRDIYFPYIEQVFREQKVPDVLKYVAMQESLLNPQAESPVGAAGLWQFMPATARMYGLMVEDSQDERYEWERATDGAALYFRKLLSLFGKGDGVLLAIASYNAGEHKIQRALGQVEDPLLHRNFGYLYRTSTLLAKETREYVPKILARAIIDRHREYYGF